MGFSTDNILITSNSIHIIPDGFVAGATNFVAATHHELRSGPPCYQMR